MEYTRKRARSRPRKMGDPREGSTSCLRKREDPEVNRSCPCKIGEPDVQQVLPLQDRGVSKIPIRGGKKVIV